jgi:hypothetical protein
MLEAVRYQVQGAVRTDSGEITLVGIAVVIIAAGVIAVIAGTVIIVTMEPPTAGDAWTGGIPDYTASDETRRAEQEAT